MSYRDITDMALRGEFLSRLLDEFIDALIEKNKLKKPSEAEIQKLREKVLEEMQAKYPDAGIIAKEDQK